MALRIRKDGRILCAAIHPEKPGDTYLDDTIHHILSGERKLLVSEPHEQHQHSGEWWWSGNIPYNIIVDSYFLKE